MTRGPTARTVRAPVEFRVAVRAAMEPHALSVIRHVVAGAGLGAGIDALGADDLRLAVSEICTAAIQRRGPAPRELELEVWREDGSLWVRLRAPVDPQYRAPFSEALPLVAAMAESVEVAGSGANAEVTLSFGLGER